jgi:WD40 repeat protein
VGNTVVVPNVTSLALSSDGFTLAVGDYDYGSVNVFRLDGNTWNQLGQSIVALELFDGFGLSVSLSADGKIVAGGAYGYSDYTGNARVFALNDQNQWEQMGSTLLGDSGDDYFGVSVALSRDGLTLAVGANVYDGAAGADTGLVRVFQFVNNDWQQVGQDLEGMAEYDHFGSSVAISADGSTVAGGAIPDRGPTVGYVQSFSIE